MTIDKLKRVMQLLEPKKDERNHVYVEDVEKAIISTVGYDYRTIRQSLDTLKKLGWLRKVNQTCFKIGSEYVTEEF